MEKDKTLTELFQKEKIILNESYLTISYNKSENWLFTVWNKDRTQEELLKGVEQIIEAVKSTGSNKLIADSSDIKTIWPELTEWFALNYAPRLQAAGIEYFAWIYNDEDAIKPTADAILQKEKSDILVMIFDNQKTAEAWLRSIR